MKSLASGCIALNKMAKRQYSSFAVTGVKTISKASEPQNFIWVNALAQKRNRHVVLKKVGLFNFGAHRITPVMVRLPIRTLLQTEPCTDFAVNAGAALSKRNVGFN